MLFERRTFGYYERVLGNCIDVGRRGQQACLSMLFILAVVAIAMFSVLVSVHASHVNREGCFARALPALAKNLSGVANETSPMDRFLPSDVFRIYITGITTAYVFSGYTSPDDDNGPDYVFSGTREGVSLSLAGAMAIEPAFRVFNLTLEDGDCLSPETPSSPLIRHLWISYDTVMVNDAMYALPTRAGFIANAFTKEPWSWGPVATNTWDLKASDRWLNSLEYRLGVLGETVFLFFLMSSTCALLVRALWSSGPAICYPIVALLSRAATADRVFDERHLNRSVPWLGQHVRALRAFGASTGPLVCANLAYLFFVFLLNMAALVFTNALYGSDKSLPYGLPSTIWSVFLAAEIFSMLMLRSAMGIIAFPRLFAAAFVATQAYIFAYPYAFFDLAVGLFSVTTLWIALAVVLWCEMPALASGEVSWDKPRAFMVQVGGTEPATALPQLFSLFMPVNARLVTIDADEEEEGGDGHGAAAEAQRPGRVGPQPSSNDESRGDVVEGGTGASPLTASSVTGSDAAPSSTSASSATTSIAAQQGAGATSSAAPASTLAGRRGRGRGESSSGGVGRGGGGAGGDVSVRVGSVSLAPVVPTVADVLHAQPSSSGLGEGDRDGITMRGARESLL